MLSREFLVQFCTEHKPGQGHAGYLGDSPFGLREFGPGLRAVFDSVTQDWITLQLPW